MNETSAECRQCSSSAWKLAARPAACPAPSIRRVWSTSNTPRSQNTSTLSTCSSPLSSRRLMSGSWTSMMSLVASSAVLPLHDRTLLEVYCKPIYKGCNCITVGLLANVKANNCLPRQNWTDALTRCRTGYFGQQIFACYSFIHGFQLRSAFPAVDEHLLSSCEAVTLNIDRHLPT